MALFEASSSGSPWLVIPQLALYYTLPDLSRSLTRFILLLVFGNFYSFDSNFLLASKLALSSSHIPGRVRLVYQERKHLSRAAHQKITYILQIQVGMFGLNGSNKVATVQNRTMFGGSQMQHTLLVREVRLWKTEQIS